MRELKVRLYDLTMGMYRVLDNQHDTFFIRGDGSLEYYNLQNGSGGSEYIIEQFTGLLDKNGKEIFEGDIVRECWCWSRYDSDRCYDISQIQYNIDLKDHRSGFNVGGVGPNYMEVIGTIHDAEYKELAK